MQAANPVAYLQELLYAESVAATVTFLEAFSSENDDSPGANEVAKNTSESTAWHAYKNIR
jgi:hypothetical protein